MQKKSKEPKKTSNSSYQKTTLIYKKEITKELQKLDPDQRYVVNVLMTFARFLKLAKNGRCRFRTPPLMVVEGDAGSVKSEGITTLCQVMEYEFREAGDDPDKFYILKCAFTGEAATDITGQSLHTLFNFNFGNSLFKLSDEMRDKMLDQLHNLILIIIDEYSVLSADTLCQIHLRLQEIKMRPQEVFRGVAVVLLENVIQLPPVNENTYLKNLHGRITRKVMSGKVCGASLLRSN